MVGWQQDKPTRHIVFIGHRPHYNAQFYCSSRGCGVFWGVMRWLSRFAILFYLSVLCTPQAFAVHDLRLSPLADTQLQAVMPALPLHLADNSQTDDNDPPALPTTLTVSVRCLYCHHVLPAAGQCYSAVVLLCHQPRAPPVSSHAEYLLPATVLA